MSLSLFKRIQLRVFGYVRVGEISKSGWRGFLPLYAFNCPKHGLVENYPMGYEERLLCLKEAQP